MSSKAICDRVSRHLLTIEAPLARLHDRTILPCKMDVLISDSAYHNGS